MKYLVTYRSYGGRLGALPFDTESDARREMAKLRDQKHIRDASVREVEEDSEAFVVARFNNLGRGASHHYADDTCAEWGLGDRLKDEALKIYMAYPQHWEAMNMASKEFLWSLDMALKGYR